MKTEEEQHHPTNINHLSPTAASLRRPRGRPPGSKNKPKSPILLPPPPDPSMTPYVLELPPGAEIIHSTLRFCRHRAIGLCILTGNGVVSDVTLRQPSSTPGATVTFHGRFDILSISATILPAGSPLEAAGGGVTFTLSLAGPQGQVVGGVVVSPLLAAETVYLVAASFNNPSYHRLEEEDSNENKSPEMAEGEACDVIWAPVARAPASQHF